MSTSQAAPEPPAEIGRSTSFEPPFAELQALRTEVERLRALVGPSEESYQKLRLDVLAARDVAVAAEADAGKLRGRVVALSVEVTRAERDMEWFRHQVVHRLLGLKARLPTLKKVVRRLSHR